MKKLLFCVLATFSILSTPSYAEKVCVILSGAGTRHAALSKKTVKSGKCPRHSIEVLDTGVLANSIASKADSTVSSGDLDQGAVETSKIAEGAIITSKLAEASVVNSKIADRSITSVKLVEGAVQETHLAAGAVSGEKIGEGAVSTEKILNGAISSFKLGATSVTTIKLADSAVTNSKLANGSVTTQKLSSTGAGSGALLQADGAGGLMFGALPANQLPASLVQTNKNQTFTGLNEFPVLHIAAPLGNDATAPLGELNKDNITVAWGRVTAAGALDRNYNVASVTYAGHGLYQINLKTSLTEGLSLIPVVTPEVDANSQTGIPPSGAANVRFAVTDQGALGSSFKVYMYSGNFALVDNDFQFVVVGR